MGLLFRYVLLGLGISLLTNCGNKDEKPIVLEEKFPSLEISSSSLNSAPVLGVSSSSESVLRSSSSVLQMVEKFPLVALHASGSGRYPVGEIVSLISENKSDSGLCFVGWGVSPAKYENFLKEFSADSAHFIVPEDSVIIEAMFRSCFENLSSVIIGNLRWMTSNLNVWTLRGSSCYKKESKNCRAYGRLYNYETAKTVCASGWRLPTDEEWTSMLNSLGEDAGLKLKSKTGWADDGSNPGNGTDAVGFNAIPSGIVYEENYMYLGYHAFYWTATEKDSASAYFRSVSYDNMDPYRYYNFKTAGYAVRCVQDLKPEEEQNAESQATETK
ncbi:MAG: FISUMP domain-containing protein [Fibrobacteraceae bacterium]